MNKPLLIGLGVLIALSLWKRERIAAVVFNKTPWDDVFSETENKWNLPPNLLKAVARKESDFDPEAVSPVGAAGLMQFMPTTAGGGAGYGINAFDPFDPIASISAAGQLLAGLYKTLGSWPKALAAYNWGIGNVTRKGFENAPEETRNYVTKITAWANIPFNPPAEWTV